MKAMLSYVLYYAVAYYLPKTKNSSNGLFERFRAFLVGNFIESCGKNINIQPHATIARRVCIGDCSGVGKNCIVQGNVIIGKHVLMGPDVLIYTQNHKFNRTDVPIDQQGFSDEKPVVIEDDVWIGARAIILPGVTIGTGSVIGAATVVSKSLPPYSVAVGNPARIVKTRK